MHSGTIMTILSAFEGLTVAAEVEVFGPADAYTHPSDEFHSYEYDQYYDAPNKKPSVVLMATRGQHYAHGHEVQLQLPMPGVSAQIEDTSRDGSTTALRPRRGQPYYPGLHLTMLAGSHGCQPKPLVEGWPFSFGAAAASRFQRQPPSGYQLFSGQSVLPRLFLPQDMW